MKLLASGRDSDVYEYGEAMVLRRYRDGRSAEREAETMRAVAALGYPVPTVHRCMGSDIVMERVEGPTLGEVMLNGLDPERVGRTLADLHDRLHALEWSSAEPGYPLLHLDLHPLNVMMKGSSPVVIDWSNARPGPAGLDVAMTALILAQVAVADGVPTSVGITVPESFNGPKLRTALLHMLRTFTQCVSTPYKDQLPTAQQLRRRDPFQTPAELTTLDRALELAASLA